LPFELLVKIVFFCQDDDSKLIPAFNEITNQKQKIMAKFMIIFLFTFHRTMTPDKIENEKALSNNKK
jgi:hypothetical protein